jgi:hypothetical protein
MKRNWLNLSQSSCCGSQNSFDSPLFSKLDQTHKLDFLRNLSSTALPRALALAGILSSSGGFLIVNAVLEAAQALASVDPHDDQKVTPQPSKSDRQARPSRQQQLLTLGSLKRCETSGTP